jgi:hypothetical protein
MKETRISGYSSLKGAIAECDFSETKRSATDVVLEYVVLEYVVLEYVVLEYVVLKERPIKIFLSDLGSP